jgi:hypothetical protein
MERWLKCYRFLSSWAWKEYRFLILASYCTSPTWVLNGINHVSDLVLIDSYFSYFVSQVCTLRLTLNWLLLFILHIDQPLLILGDLICNHFSDFALIESFFLPIRGDGWLNTSFFVLTGGYFKCIMFIGKFLSYLVVVGSYFSCMI